MAISAMRRAVLTAVICFGILLPGVPPAAAKKGPSAGIATLAGRTSISVTKTAAMEVRLPEDARIRVLHPGSEEGDPIPDIAISGKGRLTGLYLTQPDVSNFGNIYLSSYQVRFCADEGCDANDRSYQFAFASAYDAATSDEHRHPAWVKLPAGKYLLYAFTDGAPASIRLRLHGIPGSTSVRPASEVDSGFSVPTPGNSTTAPGGKAFWYGHEATFQGPAGVFFGVLRMRVEDWAYLQWGTCAVHETLILPRPLGYSPLCPEGFGGSSVDGTYVLPVDDGFIAPFQMPVTPGGTWGFGQYFFGVFAEAEFDTLAFHLDLDPSAIR